MYNIIADLHTHTLASTHAYSTVQEMAVSAHEKGLFALALTDHARTMPGAPGPWFFTAMRELPLLYKGVLLLAGMEANVLDFSGALDMRSAGAWTGSSRRSTTSGSRALRTRRSKSAHSFG